MAAHRSDDDEADIRRLLSAMSEPRPVPEDLASRISASLEQERRRGRDDLCRFDPALGRPRTSRRSRAVIAAGLITVIGVAGVSVLVPGTAAFVDRQASGSLAALRTHVDPGALRPSSSSETPAHEAPAQETPGHDASASEPSPTDAATAETTATATSTAISAPAPTSSTNAEPPSAGAGFTVVASGLDYRRGHLTSQAQSILDRGDSATDAETDHSTLPPRRLVERCLAGLALLGSTVTVDVATYNGRPALVVLERGDGDGSARTLAVMPRTCGEATATPLAGPYTFR